MPTQLTSYKVFIASPGGLEAERKLFRDCIAEYNDSEAVSCGCHFQAVGWEITLGGVGRPQALINEDLKKCDYFIMVLWDRWGSATGSAEGHSSGTQEEFDLAMQLLKDEKACMHDIFVLFKAIETRQLSDPGPNLRAVLDFKNKLETDRTLLFETFRETGEFATSLRRHLAQWRRQHEASGETVASSATSGLTTDGEAEISDTNTEEQREIEAIINNGSRSAAEEKLAAEVINSRSMRSFELYAIFLIKEHRYTEALTLYREMRKVAESADDLSWAATAIAREAGVYRAQGLYADAEMWLKKALQMKEEIGDIRGARAVGTWLGDLLFTRERYMEAMNTFEKALNTDPCLYGERKAEIQFKIAKCLAKLERFDEAFATADAAKELYEGIGSQSGLHSIKMWRKSTLARRRSSKPMAKLPR